MKNLILLTLLFNLCFANLYLAKDYDNSLSNAQDINNKDISNKQDIKDEKRVVSKSSYKKDSITRPKDNSLVETSTNKINNRDENIKYQNSSKQISQTNFVKDTTTINKDELNEAQNFLLNESEGQTFMDGLNNPQKALFTDTEEIKNNHNYISNTQDAIYPDDISLLPLPVKGISGISKIGKTVKNTENTIAKESGSIAKDSYGKQILIKYKKQEPNKQAGEFIKNIKEENSKLKSNSFIEVQDKASQKRDEYIMLKANEASENLYWKQYRVKAPSKTSKKTEKIPELIKKVEEYDNTLNEILDRVKDVLE